MHIKKKPKIDGAARNLRKPDTSMSLEPLNPSPGSDLGSARGANGVAMLTATDGRERVLSGRGGLAPDPAQGHPATRFCLVTPARGQAAFRSPER